MTTNPKDEAEIDRQCQRQWELGFTKEKDGAYFVRVVEIPGCMSAGDSLQHAHEMIQDALRLWITDAVMSGQKNTIPVPNAEREHERLRSKVARMDEPFPPEESIATNVVVARAERGFSQQELADRAEIHKTDVIRIEDGLWIDFPRVTLGKIANALNKTVDELTKPVVISSKPLTDDELEQLGAESKGQRGIPARVLHATMEEAAASRPTGEARKLLRQQPLP
jgi:predicted RNase H-like HicB family nuclease/DNA-binding XRE family transcriptional regulator